MESVEYPGEHSLVISDFSVYSLDNNRQERRVLEPKVFVFDLSLDKGKDFLVVVNSLVDWDFGRAFLSLLSCKTTSNIAYHFLPCYIVWVEVGGLHYVLSRVACVYSSSNHTSSHQETVAGC